jgi:2-iminobutanoate/2-iminopropanoate deaminase
MYEPSHGSVPKLAGLDRANPMATIMSAAMMLRYSLDLAGEAEAIESAIRHILAEGCRTPDLFTGAGKLIGTSEAGDLIAAKVRSILSAKGNKTRRRIETTTAPAAIGPYAQANAFGGLIFTSGQIPIDPATGELAGGGIESQTERSLKNLSAILAAAGSSMDKVLKTTVFLSDMNNFAAMNAVYARYFNGENLPSRSAVQAALPKGALVEIEAVAAV